jgi:hypothetical protein
MRIAALAMTILLAIGVLPSAAQTSSSAVAGVVTDSSGGVLPGVTVTATNGATGFSRTVVTGELGAYRLSELPPGTYSLTFELAGFAPVDRKSIVLTIGAEAVASVSLQVGSVQESVTVSGEAALVEVSEKSVSTTITPKEVDALPVVGRKFVNLASLAPGVTSDYSSTTSTTDSIAFGGLGETYKSLWLEGVDIADQVTAGGTTLSDASRLSVPQEAVQEFQVMANQYSTEFGRSASGVINVLGKSGTNAIQGRAYYFLKGQNFDKPNYFSTGKTPYKQQQGGASFGGPIVKNRAFFFGTFDSQYLANVVTYSVPAFLKPILPDFVNRSEAPQPSHSNHAYGRLTWTLSPSQYLSVTGLGGAGTQDLQTTGGRTAADAGYTDMTNDKFVAGSLSSVLRNGWTHVLRLSWSDAVKNRPTSGPPGPIVNFPSFTYGERGNYPQNRSQQNYIAMSTTSYHHETKRMGIHDVKFGAEMNITKGGYDQNRVFNGQYDFLQDKLPVPGDLSTYPVTFQIRTGTGQLNRDVDVYGFFVEDKMNLRHGFTLTAGLRYDPQFWRGGLNGQDIPGDIPIEQFWARFVAGDLKGTNYKAVPNDNNNLGPRIGFAWDMNQKGTTVVRGGWGLFNGFINTSPVGGAIGNYPDVLTQTFANDFRVTGIPNGAFPALMPLSQLSKSGSASVSVPVPASLAQFPQTQQYTLGVERQVSGSTAVAAYYIRLLGENFPRDYNVNSRRADGTYPVLGSGIIMNANTWNDPIRTQQFQVQLVRRLRRDFSFKTSYTYLHANSFANPVNANDPFNAVNWGPTLNDVHHRFVANATYRLPFDVNLGTVVTATSAPPYNIITGVDDNRDRNVNDRPIVHGAMLTPFAGRGDTYFDTDLRLSKTVKLSGARRFEVMFEMFNLLNTVNYANYNGNQRAVTFGQPSLAMSPFQGQFGVRFDF